MLNIDFAGLFGNPGRKTPHSIWGVTQAQHLANWQRCTLLPSCAADNGGGAEHKRRVGQSASARQSQGAVGRPRMMPKSADIAKRTMATKKTIFASSIAVPAMPPKPKAAAISATIKKVIAQPNIK